MQHEAFRSGNFDTKFVVKTRFTPEMLQREEYVDEETLAVALATHIYRNGKRRTTGDAEIATKTSRWRERKF